MVGTQDIFIDCRDEPLDDKDFPAIFHVGKGESIPGGEHYSFSKYVSSGTCCECKRHTCQENLFCRGEESAQLNRV